MEVIINWMCSAWSVSACYRIYCNKGEKEAVLQGWWDISGLLRVNIKDNVENYNTDTLLIDCPAPQYAIYNLYELDFTEKTVRYLHVALVFPTKYKILKSIWKKYMLSWSSIIASVVNERFRINNRTRRRIWISRYRGSLLKKPKKSQAGQFTRWQRGKKLAPATHRKKNNVYCKI